MHNRSRRRQQPETPVMRSIMDYFMVRRIYCERMNAGQAYRDDGLGGRYWIQLHTEGCADLLAFPYLRASMTCVPFWVEVKRDAKQRRNPAQISFARHMKMMQMHYCLAWSIDVVASYMLTNDLCGDGGF